MTLRGVVLDVDGTVLRGDEPIPGAAEGLRAIADTGLRRLFFSNNPTKAPAAYERRFARAGFEVTRSEVLTSGAVTTRYLRERHPDDRLFVIGEAGFVRQLAAADLDVVEAGDHADVLVASIDREFDYDRLCEALWALDDDRVTFLGTDPDMVIPAAERDVPGSGAVIHAIAGVAGRAPERVLGKPSTYARRVVLEELDLDAEECLVVGDRLDTDVALGSGTGMTTALVRTGISDDATLVGSDVEPDYVLDSLADIGRVLDREHQ